MPIGGVIADLADRRRLLTTWQAVGAVTTAAVAALVLTGRIAVRHIYAFTLGFSLGMLWAGVAIDRFGWTALAGGAPLRGLLSVVVALIEK